MIEPATTEAVITCAHEGMTLDGITAVLVHARTYAPVARPYEHKLLHHALELREAIATTLKEHRAGGCSLCDEYSRPG